MAEPVTEPVPVVPAAPGAPPASAPTSGAQPTVPVGAAWTVEPDVSLVARFELQGRIGAGNHGVVFRARDHQLQRTVAIKRFSHFLADDPRAMHRIRREVETLARVSHPNVVTVHDLVHMPDGDGEVTPHLVMELVEGTSLRDLLALHGPSPRAVPVVQGVLDGLAACHRASILHLDIKPANVLVTTTGGVKIVDFGISRAASDATATVAGTPHYMAPEQYEGRADQRSDVYSVGCMLFECLTGRAPFGGTMASQLLAHRHEPRPDPRQLSPWVGPGLAGVVMRAMQIDPAHRYATVEEMLAALTTVAHDVLPMDAVPAPVAPTVQPASTGPVPPVVPMLPRPGAAEHPAEFSTPESGEPVVRRSDRVRWLAAGGALSAFVVALLPGLVWAVSWTAPGDHRPASMDESSGSAWWMVAVAIALVLLLLRSRELLGSLAGPAVGEPRPGARVPRETRHGIGLAARCAAIGSVPLLFPWYVLGVHAFATAIGIDWPAEPFESVWSTAWLLMPAACFFLALRSLMVLRARFGAMLWSMLHLGAAGAGCVLFAVYPMAL